MDHRTDRDIDSSSVSKDCGTQRLSPAQTIQIALQHHKAGHLPQAEQIYQQVLAVDPHHVDANHLLGVIAQQTGNNELSVHLIRKAVQSHPGFAEAHCHLGNALKALGRWDDAVASYQQALVIKPDIAEAHNNLGLVFEKTGQWDETVACYQRALAIAPD